MNLLLGKNSWLLALACILFVLLRFPSVIEPSWYGDEGIYQVIGMALNKGRMLYQEIWDNKPPLLYLIYALGNGSLFFAKLMSLLAGLLSVVGFYFLSSKLFKKKVSVYASLFLYVILFASPILEGNIANAENFMLLPNILAAYLVILYSRSGRFLFLLLAGLSLSISLSIKIVGIFDFAAFVFFLLILNKNRVKDILKHLSFFTAIFISSISASFLYFLINNAHINFLQAVFLQNFSYVGEENEFLFPMGTLLVKSILLVIALAFIYSARNKISKTSLFIYIWTALSVFSAFFSDRPYTHYLLVLLPSFCLLLGNVFENLKKNYLSILPIAIIVFISFYHFKIYRKNLSYYTNFLSFLTNQKTITDYEAFFDGNTPRDYALASFINRNVTDNEEVFLWSDSAQIYALSRKLPITKYIVAYHIEFYDSTSQETTKALQKAKPKFIIQTASGPIANDILSSYHLRYIINGARVYERQI